MNASSKFDIISKSKEAIIVVYNIKLAYFHWSLLQALFECKEVIKLYNRNVNIGQPFQC